MDKTTRNSIACDVAYAIRQLKMAQDASKMQYVADAVRRAYDALERIETALGDNGPATDDPRSDEWITADAVG